MEASIETVWQCILKQYRSKVIEDSQINGPGIAIFLMKPPSDKGPFNCKYIYESRGTPIWDNFLNFSGKREIIEKAYDPDSTYLISVQVPDDKDPTRTIGNIRGFQYDTNEEIKWL